MIALSSPKQASGYSRAVIMPILTASNIYKNYIIDGKSLPVLKGISLEINQGEILIIQGPSGAGKSTLLHIIGLLDSPSKGEVYINDKLFNKRGTGKGGRIRAKYIGFIFQFYNLLGDFNILENVCLPAMIAEGRFVLSKKIKNKAFEILDLVGLGHRLRHRPGELSGGEQQRAAIARALINKPKLLLADEPMGNLDSDNADKIWSLFVKLRDEQGQTIAIVTHNEELAKRGDRAIRLVDGVVV